MASERSPRPRGVTPPAATSDRFTIAGHAARLVHFPGRPDRQPPPGTAIIREVDGKGVFWLVPEAIRLARPDGG